MNMINKLSIIINKFYIIENILYIMVNKKIFLLIVLKMNINLNENGIFVKTWLT